MRIADCRMYPTLRSKGLPEPQGSGGSFNRLPLKQVLPKIEKAAGDQRPRGLVVKSCRAAPRMELSASRPR
jgi:hypothetical protein